MFVHLELALRLPPIGLFWMDPRPYQLKPQQGQSHGFPTTFVMEHKVFLSQMIRVRSRLSLYHNSKLIWHSSSIHEEKRMQTLPNLDIFSFDFQTKHMVRGIHDEFTMNDV